MDVFRVDAKSPLEERNQLMQLVKQSVMFMTDSAAVEIRTLDSGCLYSWEKLMRIA